MENNIEDVQDLIKEANNLVNVFITNKELGGLQEDINKCVDNTEEFNNFLLNAKADEKLKLGNFLSEKKELEESCKHLQQMIDEAKVESVKRKKEVLSCLKLTGTEIICEDNMICGVIMNENTKKEKYVLFGKNEPNLADKLWTEVDCELE